MTDRATCDGCKDYQPSRIFKMACFRPKTFRSGRVLAPAHGIGFPADSQFETSPHDTIYEGRADGDHCGPERKHWRRGS